MSARATLHTKFRRSPNDLQFARDREASVTGDFPVRHNLTSARDRILFARVTRYTANELARYVRDRRGPASDEGNVGEYRASPRSDVAREKRDYGNLQGTGPQPRRFA
jgi:hypothetical protein